MKESLCMIAFLCSAFLLQAQVFMWDTVGNSNVSGMGASLISMEMTSAGEPVVAYKDNSYYSWLTVKKYSGGTWTNIGPYGFSVAPPTVNISLAADRSDSLWVAYVNGNTGGLCVKRNVGSNWPYVGQADFFSYPIGLALDIDSNNKPYVGFVQGGNISVMTCTGVFWNYVGVQNFHSVGSGGYMDLAISPDSNQIHVVFPDNTLGDKATVMKYNGSSWVTVGSAGFTPGSAHTFSIGFDHNGVLHVACGDASFSNRLCLFRYSGNTWTQVGLPFSSGSPREPSLAFNSLNEPYVSFSDYGANDLAIVRKFDGSTWQNVGANNISAQQSRYTSLEIDANDVPYIAFSNYAQSQSLCVKSLGSCTAPDVSTSANGNTITANAAGLSYQWIDCSNGSPLAGETGQSYSPSANGDYAVIINNNGCIDTSACVSFLFMGTEIVQNSLFTVYPNPVNDLLNIQLSTPGEAQIEIFAADGRILYQRQISGTTATIDLQALAAGIYTIRISCGEDISYRKIIRN